MDHRFDTQSLHYKGGPLPYAVGSSWCQQRRAAFLRFGTSIHQLHSFQVARPSVPPFVRTLQPAQAQPQL